MISKKFVVNSGQEYLFNAKMMLSDESKESGKRVERQRDGAGGKADFR